MYLPGSKSSVIPGRASFNQYLSRKIHTYTVALKFEFKEVNHSMGFAKRRAAVEHTTGINGTWNLSIKEVIPVFKE